jgi:hypothetical protein
MTADNWSFVFAAYGLAAVVLATYWRFLVRREKELEDAGVVRRRLEQTTGVAGHPRSEPSTRSPLP